MKRRAIRQLASGALLLALTTACGLGNIFNDDPPPAPTASTPVVAPAVQIGGANVTHDANLLHPQLHVDCTLLNNTNTTIVATLQATMRRRTTTETQRRTLNVNPGHQVERFTFGADVGESDATGGCAVVP